MRTRSTTTLQICGRFAFLFIMKEIKLTQGQVALVDDSDYESLNAFKWYAMKNGNVFYAVRNITVNGKQIKILMHCDILGGKGIDHIDHNGTNNQRYNLRFATQSENNMNQRKRANTSSKFKGVTWDKKTGKWVAHIKINGKLKYLGLFKNEIDGAKAYNAKAIEHFGEFANINTF